MPNERASDGTYYAYFPFGALSLVPQIAAYHNKLNLDEVVLYGIDHKIGGIFATRLFKNIGTMLIHGALRDKEFVSNLLV